MALVAAVLGSVLASVARAAQPGAASPVAVPMRDLQWGQINFLHTTDTHGWHGGHLQESQYSADWGDYVSFAHHMRKRADDEGRDLLLVDTGDRVEGNGLYDGSDPKGKYYFDIYREQDVDIICTGNHELYQASTADDEHRRTVPNFKNNYIASNVDYIDPKSGDRIPMARRYKKFQTKNQKINIVAFGFLFDFTGNANNTVVKPVRNTIREQWFGEAIREKPDLFVVIGHVGVRMQEFRDIYTAIRKQNWHTPIAFFGGHAHVRDAVSFDDKAFAMASGRYMETIGWMSVDGISVKNKVTSGVSFQRRYIDNNLLGLYHHSGLDKDSFPTEHGRNVTKTIAKAREALDLDYTYGCAPRDLWMTRSPYPSKDSIYTWLAEEVLPDVVVNEKRKDKARLGILNTGAIRFDIFKGAFTTDTTFIVSPFLSSLAFIPDVPYHVARKIIDLLNNSGPIVRATAGPIEGTDVPDPRFMSIPEQWHIKKPIVHHQKSASALLAQPGSGNQRPLGDDDSKGKLVGGYTTVDDFGHDGDDAVHSPIDFYTVPNCVEAEINFPRKSNPETVDLVFIDFIQPWVLLALKYAGGHYTAEDVELYRDGSFTDLMAGWIKENWKPC
ncbi:Metallo-dependent phosphatase-like protein [Coniochaeta sp. 2T2.1]|nr:Metallo-dependent phosphatase-like protein [Coniochaeta sp. 2T2.1]